MKRPAVITSPEIRRIWDELEKIEWRFLAVAQLIETQAKEIAELQSAVGELRAIVGTPKRKMLSPKYADSSRNVASSASEPNAGLAGREN